MLRLISRYSISRRLIAAFALAAFIPSVMIALIGTYYVNQINTRAEPARVISNAQSQTNSLSVTLQQMYAQTKVLETQVLSEVAVPGSKAASTIKADAALSVGRTTTNTNTFATQLTSYQRLYDPVQSGNMQAVNSLISAVAPTDDTLQADSNLIHGFASGSWPQYRQAQAAELTLLQQIANAPNQFSAKDAVNQITTHATALNQTYTAANSDLIHLGSYVSKLSNDINGIDTNQAQPVLLSTVGAFLLTLILVTVAGILVLRSITGPLTELVSLTKRISKGETTARARLVSQDEIAIVGNSMNSMLDNIVRLIQDTQAQRDGLQGQVEKLVSEVSGVGEGDLRVQAEVTADALGVLADSFNYMVEELGSLVVRVKSVAREVGESTTMTSDRMNELVETADRQIQQIVNAALEIERVAITSQQVAGRAQDLAGSAREARTSAQGGRQAVQQTIEGMGRIYHNVQETSTKVQTLGERSREINNIVEAISTIAHQTNRLALDAAIQAAMAGENGKGFGAVAADIRRLAERAKEQATSVGRIVRSVRDDIGAVAISMHDTERETSAGSTLAREVGTSLESIFSVVERQAHEIEVINQMAVQQQQSSSDVVQIMQGVSESTQTSTTSTRNAAQDMEHVARLAEQLLASVEAFKLRENQNYAMPNGANPLLMDHNAESAITLSGRFRTVTATAQPITSNGGRYNSSPFSNTGGNSAPAPYSPSDLYIRALNNEQQFPQPQAQLSAPSAAFQGQNSGNSQPIPPFPNTPSGPLSLQARSGGTSQQISPFPNTPSGPLSLQVQSSSTGQQISPFPNMPSGSLAFPAPGGGKQFASFPSQQGSNPVAWQAQRNGQRAFPVQDSLPAGVQPPQKRPPVSTPWPQEQQKSFDRS